LLHTLSPLTQVPIPSRAWGRPSACGLQSAVNKSLCSRRDWRPGSSLPFTFGLGHLPPARRRPGERAKSAGRVPYNSYVIDGSRLLFFPGSGGRCFDIFYGVNDSELLETRIFTELSHHLRSSKGASPGGNLSCMCIHIVDSIGMGDISETHVTTGKCIGRHEQVMHQCKISTRPVPSLLGK
jgi:hypothetical protein